MAPDLTLGNTMCETGDGALTQRITLARLRITDRTRLSWTRSVGFKCSSSTGPGPELPHPVVACFGDDELSVRKRDDGAGVAEFGFGCEIAVPVEASSW